MVIVKSDERGLGEPGRLDRPPLSRAKLAEVIDLLVLLFSLVRLPAKTAKVVSGMFAPAIEGGTWPCCLAQRWVAFTRLDPVWRPNRDQFWRGQLGVACWCDTRRELKTAFASDDVTDTGTTYAAFPKQNNRSRWRILFLGVSSRFLTDTYVQGVVRHVPTTAASLSPSLDRRLDRHGRSFGWGKALRRRRK